MESLFYQENFEPLQPSNHESANTSPRTMPFNVFEFGEPLSEKVFDQPTSPRHLSLYDEDVIERPLLFCAPLLP